MAAPFKTQILAMGASFADFIRRLFSRPEPRSNEGQPAKAMPSERSYKRNFRRYPIAFDVSVSFPPSDAPPWEDQGELQDISGGGALFIPCRPDKYYVGQPLETVIYLAGTSEVQGCVRSEARVVRVGAVPGAGPEKVHVGVQFERAFDFERINGGSSGMDA
ncbi:MAG: PilZ domain-containing protein [Desulfosalsimonadaceae bacterium]